MPRFDQSGGCLRRWIQRHYRGGRMAKVFKLDFLLDLFAFSLVENCWIHMFESPPLFSLLGNSDTWDMFAVSWGLQAIFKQQHATGHVRLEWRFQFSSFQGLSDCPMFSEEQTPRGTFGLSQRSLVTMHFWMATDWRTGFGGWRHVCVTRFGKEWCCFFF